MPEYTEVDDQFVVATGDPFNGVQLWGPFQSSDEALEWAEEGGVDNDYWWIVNVNGV